MRRIKPILLALAYFATLSITSARNVIVFIGDGMGFEHVQAGRLYVTGSDSGQLSFETLPYLGQAKTTLPDGGITDSATAGTALATGYQHPVNGVISMDTNGNPVETILEQAKSMGLRTGIISTDDIAGATPGAFGAHEPDRGLMTEIRLDFLLDDTDHVASRPNILFGGGASASYSQEAQGVGYSVSTDSSSLWAMDFNALPAPYALGQFASSIMTRENDRLPGNTEPRLVEMVDRSLELLSQEPNGFFLMVEGALIDKLSHDNAADDLCPEVEQFHIAVQSAMDWVAANGGPSETLIIVTADHETGGLYVPDGQSITPGTMPALSYSSGGHTADDVPFFASWPAAVDSTRIDNTETFFIVEDWLAGINGCAPVAENLQVSNIKQTSASVSWDTREPASCSYACYQGTTLVASGSDANRTTSHQFNIQGLDASIDYTLEVTSQDLAGFAQTETVNFTTAAPDVDAYVAADPTVSVGSVVGAFSALDLADGLTQTLTEAPSGVGAALDATYVLHTSAQVSSIISVTLNASFSWSNRDKGNDHALMSIMNISSGQWELLAQDTGGSYPLTTPLDYVDAQGNIYVRFTDSAIFTKEKKESVSIDQLVAAIVVGAPDQEAPSIPSGVVAEASQAQELTALVSWTPNSEPDLAGYYVQRVGLQGEFFTTEASFTDQVLTAGYYEYIVSAADLSGNRSDWTTAVGATLENSVAPITPQNLVVVGGDSCALLDWDDNPEWDIVGYNIFQWDTDQWIRIEEHHVASDYFVSGLVNGQTYEFCVTAIDSLLESAPTASVQVTPSDVPSVLVDSITVSLQAAGKNWKANATVQVMVDDVAVAGATVTGNWLFEGQVIDAGVTGITDAAGNFATTSSPQKATSGTFTFQILSVELDGYEYDAASSVTEGSATIN